jgi:YgiT-type zinc finger domain-containing protein
MSTVDLCPACHFGRLHERQITHAQLFGEQLIVIPNVSALVCDVCGEKILDEEMLSRLSGLLGQGRSSSFEAAPRPPHP